jgi:formylglycine-generating enzyme required for sulfatase activity
VLRGGGWHFSAVHCRSASRLHDYPGARSYADFVRGFRPARSSVR